MTVQPLRKERMSEPATPRSRAQALIDAGMKPSRIAVEAGVRSGELATWLGGADSNRIQASVAAWLDEREEVADHAGSGPEWVPTETALAIMSGLEYARATPAISLIYGGAGLGKTVSATRYAETCRDGKVYHVNATVLKTRTDLLRAIYKAVCGDDYLGAYRSSSLAEALCQRTGVGDLLIVDEAQRLDADALDAARYLFDEVALGIAYLGNEAIFKRIGGRGRSAEFAQLQSRVGYRLHLAHPSESDIDQILQAWRVSGAEERAYAHAQAQGPGGLRVLVNILRGARGIAAVQKEPMSLRGMREAAVQFGIGD